MNAHGFAAERAALQTEYYSVVNPARGNALISVSLLISYLIAKRESRAAATSSHEIYRPLLHKFDIQLFFLFLGVCLPSFVGAGFIFYLLLFFPVL